MQNNNEIVIKTANFTDAVAPVVNSAVVVKTEIKEYTDSMEVNDFDDIYNLEESTDSKSDLDPVSKILCTNIAFYRSKFGYSKVESH